MLYNSPSKVEISELSLSRIDLCHAHISSNSLYLNILLLNEDTTVHAHILVVSTLFLAHVHLEETKILLCAENFKSLISKAWSHNDLKEDRLHKFSNLLINLTVHCNDTAKDAHLVSLISLLPRVNHISSDCCTTWVHMLKADAERCLELTYDVKSSICILNVIV